MLRIEHLSKSFGKLAVLQDLSLSFSDREVVAILGASGAGKSTLLRCINLLEMPEKGRIQIDDVCVEAPHISRSEIAALRAKSAMVFQNYALFKNKTVLENVTLALLRVKKMAPEQADRIARELLERVQLADKIQAYPAHLSGGQQQRVGIARALAANPPVLLFDEPTSALDPENVEEVQNIIRKIAAEEQKCLLIVTHDRNFAKGMADTVVIMQDGRISRQGRAEELLD